MYFLIICINGNSLRVNSITCKNQERLDHPFIVGNIFHKQIDGVAMSPPLGPILVNAFLCHYKKFWHKN